MDFPIYFIKKLFFLVNIPSNFILFFHQAKQKVNNYYVHKKQIVYITIFYNVHPLELNYIFFQDFM